MNEPESSVLEQVVNSISRYSMLAPGQRVGVGVSGGADSTALLHVLHRLAPEHGWVLVALHLNHCLRGAESDGDASFVADLAQSMGLAAILERRELPAGGNVEETARRIRYEFFRECRERERLDRIALGHTRSDQAETVLFRLLRGTGTTGLAGIWPVTEEGIVRPLIDVSRDDVVGYLRAHDLKWREDSSNTDRRFARNRLRHDLLPALRRDWNPEIDSALGRLASVCQEEERYWGEEAARLLDETGSMIGDVLILDVRKLRVFSDAALRRVMREAATRVRGNPRGLDYDHYEELVRLVRKRTGAGSVTLPGLYGRRSFDRLRLASSAGKSARYRLALPVPGEVSLPLGGRLRLELERATGECGYNRSGEAVDWDRVSGTLELRSWLPGDTFHPAGGPERKVKDLFQEARIPSWERPDWPIISLGNTVVWVRDFGVAEPFGASSSSRTLLWLREIDRDREGA
jgi:tRNA(Ile)-lysidine synthase